MTSHDRTGPPRRTRRRPGPRRLLLTAAACGLACAAVAAAQDAQDGKAPAGAAAGASAAAPDGTTAAPTLEETRLTMDKWIETQQIISKERKDWQQGREILQSRLELVNKEIGTLEESLQQAQSGVAEAQSKREELETGNQELETVGAQLAATTAGMEGEVRRLLQGVPEPIRTRLQPLTQRIPEDAATTRVSTAERLQNVLGILDALNKASSEITVSYEVRTLADGKPSEVKVIYVGLVQAYYVSARGEAGIGRPSADGWIWESSPAVADDVLLALEILQGKHTPAFVPLPVRLK